MRRILSLILLCAAYFAFIVPAADAHASDSDIWQMPAPDLLEKLRQNEDELNLFCLKSAYPQIKSNEADQDGNIWLVLDGGKKVLYRGRDVATQKGFDSLSTTVAESMALPYALEPERPDLPAGYSPGRARSIALLAALYGGTQDEVRKGLASTRFRGGAISLSQAPARAFQRAAPELEKLATEKPALRPFLVPDGGFNWRKIAGEKRPSPHSYGIALDLGSKVAPYWRWAKVNPHPAQKTYSGDIVKIMEDKGFIWGGKWHEYDLMHFEYRPELICKARINTIQRYSKRFCNK